MKYLITALSALLLLNFINCTTITAKIESCASCQLNRLPEVKKFIYDDVPKYEDVEFKKIPGAPPELVIFNEHEEEIERIKLAPFTREECNHLLVQKGFKLKGDANKKEL